MNHSIKSQLLTKYKKLKTVFNNTILRFIKPDKDNFNNLISDLNDAEKLLSEFNGGYSNHFSSADEFYKAYSTELKKIKADLNNKKYPDLNLMYGWFLPTSDWDDFTGLDGMKLANKISKKLERLKK